MSKARRILVTSCKGGVGKSTVAANLAFALAKRGRRVLVVDLDLGNRTLDLILGVEDSTIYDICDVASGKIAAKDALIASPARVGLYFCPGPYRYGGGLDTETLDRVLTEINGEFEFDYIFLDTSGGADESVSLAASVSEEAIIVTSQNPTAVRAAEKSGILLDEMKVSKQYLVVNSFDLEGSAKGYRATIIDIIDRTKTRIIGIVPAEEKLALAQENGKLAGELRKRINSASAFENIAARFEGERVPLLRGFKRTNRRLLLK